MLFQINAVLFNIFLLVIEVAVSVKRLRSIQYYYLIANGLPHALWGGGNIKFCEKEGSMEGRTFKRYSNFKENINVI